MSLCLLLKQDREELERQSDVLDSRIYSLHLLLCCPLCWALVSSSGEGDGTPLQHSCLENPTDGGAWWATVHGITKSQTRLSDFTFHFHALEKEMATHSSVLARESLVGCRLWSRT